MTSTKQQPEVDLQTLRHAVHVLDRGARKRWWRRKGSKERGFRYVDAAGARITDAPSLARIKALRIPPAWLDVRVSPSARSRLQAIGIDTSGRVQYLYSPSFVEKRQRAKYDRIVRFGERLPLLRERTNEDIALEGLPRERVLAIVLRFINDLYFRLGAESSVTRYKTYGVTTLRNRHLEIGGGGELVFDFVGKHHIRHRRLVVDEELAEVMREVKAFAGSRLFNYTDAEGKAHPVTPRDVNEYIKSAMGSEFSAKDFRTWGGTLQAALELADLGPCETEKQAKRRTVEAVKRVAERLGNTPSVCRECYIHPTVLQRYQQGVTLREFRKKAERYIRRHQPDYEPEELALLELLRTA